MLVPLEIGRGSSRPEGAGCERAEFDNAVHALTRLRPCGPSGSVWPCQPAKATTAHRRRLDALRSPCHEWRWSA